MCNETHTTLHRFGFGRVCGNSLDWFRCMYTSPFKEFFQGKYDFETHSKQEQIFHVILVKWCYSSFWLLNTDWAIKINWNQTNIVSQFISHQEKSHRVKAIDSFPRPWFRCIFQLIDFQKPRRPFSQLATVEITSRLF